MEKQFENFIIEYSPTDNEYIEKCINMLLSKQQSILNFFGLEKLNHKVHIHLWNNINDFRTFYKQNHPNYKNSDRKVPEWIVGVSHTNDHNENFIDILSLNELRKCQGHQKDTIDDITKLVIHEFVHAVHKEYKNYIHTMNWIDEALATNLSNQYNNQQLNLDCSLENIVNGTANYVHYFSLGYYILSNYSHDYVLKLARDNDFLKEETPKLFNKAKASFNDYFEVETKEHTKNK